MSNRPIQNNLVLELHIPNFDQAREFYGLFGFQELSYDPTSGGGSELGYLVLIRKDGIGNSIINFYGDSKAVTQHAHLNDFPSDTPRGYAVEITFPVSDVESLWDEVSSSISDETIAQELQLKRWGKKDFRVIDPFGFYIRFTEIVDWGQ